MMTGDLHTELDAAVDEIVRATEKLAAPFRKHYCNPGCGWTHDCPWAGPSKTGGK